MPFRALIIGGTGQVGAAVVRALVAEPACTEIVMVVRKAAPEQPRVRQVTMDTAAADFSAQVTELARSVIALGDPVHAASCVGVGKGSNKWSEEQLVALEVGVVGAFARGCHAAGIHRFALLSAAGSSSKSKLRYVRVMGLKEENVAAIGFDRVAVFRPGIIGGNAHTPKVVDWLGRVLPGKYGTIDQDAIGHAFVAEMLDDKATGIAYLENKAMSQAAASRHP